MDSRLLIAIPTYNERDNIKPLLSLLAKTGLQFDLLFVDDNSPDGTAELIESMKAEWPSINLLKRPGKLGIGSAHHEAIRWAYAHGYSALATLDADLTHNPEILPRFLEQLRFGDVVIGSRFVVRGSLPGWNIFRRMMTYLGHFLTCFFLKMPYDATGAMRVYNLKTIPKELFGLVRSSGYSFFYESLFILWQNGCRVVELPISLPARTYGSSKMSKEQVLISLLRLALLYTHIRTVPDLYRLKRLPPGEPVRCSDASPSSDWERYWGGEKSESAADLLFELLATWFRSLFIRPPLDRIMQKFFSAEESVLHAGCGSGHVDKNLRYWLKITGCDLSRTAVGLYEQANWPHCKVVREDITSLSFANEQFDGVYNLGVMEHFDTAQIQRVLAEFYRVLRPGGRIVLFWPPLKSPMRYILGVFSWLMQRLHPGKKGAPYPPEISRVRSREEVEGWLDEAGFEPIYYEFGPRDLYTQCVFVAKKKESMQ